MDKIYTNEHKDRFILVRKYIKDMIKQQVAEDFVNRNNTQSKKLQENTDILFGYKQLMPEYIKNLMKKGEAFTVEKIGHKHYLSNEDTVDEIEGRIEISNEDIDNNSWYFAYMDHVDFENEGLQYSFEIKQKNVITGAIVSKRWDVKMDPIGKDTWNELLNFVTIYYHESDNINSEVKEVRIFSNISSGDILNLNIRSQIGDDDSSADVWEMVKHYVLPDEELNVLKDYAGVPHRQKLIKDGLPF